MVELLWVADGILHHVDSVSGLANALPMKEQHCEEKTEVHSQVVLEGEVKGIHCQDATDKGHLDHEKENCSVKDIHLIIDLKLKLFFVGLHESKVADGVHVG